MEVVLFAHTGRCYSYKDMAHRSGLVNMLRLRMLQNQGKVAKICRDSCNLNLLNKVIRHFDFVYFRDILYLRDSSRISNGGRELDEPVIFVTLISYSSRDQVVTSTYPHSLFYREVCNQELLGNR